MTDVYQKVYIIDLDDGTYSDYSDLDDIYVFDATVDTKRVYLSDRLVPRQDADGNDIVDTIDIEATDKLNPGWDGVFLRDRPVNLPAAINDYQPTATIANNLFSYADFINEGVSIYLKISFDETGDKYSLEFSPGETLSIKTKSLSPYEVSFVYRQADGGDGNPKETQVDFSLGSIDLVCLIIIQDGISILVKDPATQDKLVDLTADFQDIAIAQSVNISETINENTFVKLRQFIKKIPTMDEAKCLIGNNIEYSPATLAAQVAELERLAGIKPDYKSDPNVLFEEQDTITETLAVSTSNDITALKFLQDNSAHRLWTRINEQDLTYAALKTAFGASVIEYQDSDRNPVIKTDVDLVETRSYLINLVDADTVKLVEVDETDLNQDRVEIGDRVLLPTYTGKVGVKTIDYILKGYVSSYTAFFNFAIFKADGTAYRGNDFVLSDFIGIAEGTARNLMDGGNAAVARNSTARFKLTFPAPTSDIISLRGGGKYNGSSGFGWTAYDDAGEMLFNKPLGQVKNTLSFPIALAVGASAELMAIQKVVEGGQEIVQLVGVDRLQIVSNTGESIYQLPPVEEPQEEIISDRFYDSVSELEVDYDYRDLKAVHTIKEPGAEDDGKVLGLWANTVDSEITAPAEHKFIFNDNTEGTTFELKEGNYAAFAFDSEAKTFTQAPLNSSAAPTSEENAIAKVDSDMLLGTGFVDWGTKNPKPGKIYLGDSWQAGEKPKLEALINSDVDVWIPNIVTKSGNTYTLVNTTDFVRPGTDKIGEHQDDTTAVKGLKVNSSTIPRLTNRVGVSGGPNLAWFADGGNSSQSLHSHSLSSEDQITAPPHVNRWHGIYGDSAIAVVDLDTYTIDSAIADGDLITIDKASKEIKTTSLSIIGSPAFTGLQRIGDRYRPAELEVASSRLETGLDLTRATGSLRIQLTDSNETGRPFPLAEIDLEEIRENNGFYIWNHDNSYLSATINDLATGDFTLTDQTRNARFIYAEVVDFAENGFTIPTGTQIVTPRSLVVTTPSGASSHTIYDEAAWSLQLTPTAGFQFNTTPTAQSGLSSVAISTDGKIVVQADGTGSATLEIEEKAIVRVSTRLGEFFFAKSGSSVQGYLPVTPGTITNGATLYPKWAAMYPEFISGANIIFPTNVAGMFLRNIGGNAPSEGSFQSDATAVNGLRIYTGNGTALYASNGVIGMKNGDNNWQNSRTWANANVLRGDTETHPPGYGFQLYTIVDGYLENLVIQTAGLIITNPNETDTSLSLKPNGDGTATFR